ncbi:MAG: ferritin-like domain-containing protein [Terriglobales bacterium]
MTTVHEFFVHQLHDIYNAERRLLDILAAAEESSHRGDLKRAFARHRKQTNSHVQRLDRVFQSLGEQPREETCAGLDGLVREQQSTARQDLAPELADLNLAISGLKIEHYESSAYDSLIFLAQKMSHRDAVRLMRETLTEEKETAQLLFELLKASKLDWTAGMEASAPAARPRRAA